MADYKRPIKLSDVGSKQKTPIHREDEVENNAASNQDSEKPAPSGVSSKTRKTVERTREEVKTQENTITKIEAQKRHKNRFNLYVDDQFVCGISERTLTKLMLVKGQVLTEDELKKVKDTEERSQLIERALNYLSAMPRTKSEVKKKLKDISADDSAIEEVVSHLGSLGYLDDRSYAKHYLNDSIHLKQKSPKRVQHELRQKGVSSEIIEETLAAYDEEDALANAQTLAKKKYRQYLKKTSSYSSIQKTYAFLAQKGYDSAIISEALAPLKEEEVDEERELNNLRRDRDKYYRRYQKYQDGKYRTKQQLMKKGYMRELINDVMAELED